MKLLHDLFTTDVGLFSIIGIIFMIFFMGFLAWLFTRDDGAPSQIEQSSKQK